MSSLQLKPCSVSDLEVCANPHDALHDLHIYVQYMAEHDVRRMTRTNYIPKADVKRMVKKMTNATELADIVKEYGDSGWVYFIDGLALQLGLVSYDIEGEYRGYSSQAPSFLENYISVSLKDYRNFTALAPSEQERRILDHLISQRGKDKYDRCTDNEFYRTGVFGRLDGFSRYGAATGIMPELDFPRIRNFLFNLLKNCQPEKWYSTASLIAYLKANHPLFIIPEEIKPDQRRRRYGRYENFRDGVERWYHANHVPDNAGDGFKRVEGRYIERFLEHIPLTLRFVELAYDPHPYTKKAYPMIGYLKAFKITGRFLRLVNGASQPPRVTVQPNFEVIVESEFYPAQVLAQLETLAEPAASPAGGAPVSVTTLTLKKERVAAALVQDPDLHVSAVLEKLSGGALPPNVATELAEWSSHAERFTLYEGFGLLESVDPQPQTDRYTHHEISPAIRLVRDTNRVMALLEQEGLAPIGIVHSLTGFTPLPEGAHSIFPDKTPAQEAEALPPQPVTLRKVTSLTLHFPFDEIFDEFRRTLAEERVPVQADAAVRTLTFPEKCLPALEKVIQQFETRYEIHILDE